MLSSIFGGHIAVPLGVIADPVSGIQYNIPGFVTEKNNDIE